ncbi:MAG: phosphoglycerate kinase [Candidatus Aquicultorales bacterium]
MFSKKTVKDIDVTDKRVLVRVDFNVPLDEAGNVTDDSRIRAVLPTIGYLIDQDAKVILMSHLGRPKGVDPRFRMDPVAGRLSKLLGRPVEKVDETVGPKARDAAAKMSAGDMLILENLRFNPGEEENDQDFAKALADLADIYVNDAFGVAHRKHASVIGVAQYLPSVAGFLLEKEVETLTGLLEAPKRPFVAILGGSKVSDKAAVIDKFLDVVDELIIGGGMCFTFLYAQGMNVGNSLLEEELIEYAGRTLQEAESRGIAIRLPKDIVVAERLAADIEAKVVPVREIPSGWMGLDIGPDTSEAFQKTIEAAKTIFWNGPMGVFELAQFAAGTELIAKAVASTGATTIIGGGDTVAAVEKYGVADEMSFISTGGGASMKVLEGAALPGVEALQDRGAAGMGGRAASVAM